MVRNLDGREEPDGRVTVLFFSTSFFCLNGLISIPFFPVSSCVFNLFADKLPSFRVG